MSEVGVGFIQGRQGITLVGPPTADRDARSNRLHDMNETAPSVITPFVKRVSTSERLLAIVHSCHPYAAISPTLGPAMVVMTVPSPRASNDETLT